MWWTGNNWTKHSKRISHTQKLWPRLRLRPLYIYTHKSLRNSSSALYKETLWSHTGEGDSYGFTSGHHDRMMDCHKLSLIHSESLFTGSTAKYIANLQAQRRGYKYVSCCWILGSCQLCQVTSSNLYKPHFEITPGIAGQKVGFNILSRSNPLITKHSDTIPIATIF